MRRWPLVFLAGTALAFLLLFAQPFASLARDWWADPEAGHGLLLAPLAIWFAWRAGLVQQPRPLTVLGLLVLAGAVALRLVGGLAAEHYSMRVSLWLAGAGLVIFAWGAAQLRRWWMPATLLFLAIPLPAILLNTLAFPLQLKASAMGAALLSLRDVPVRVAGNVIHLPGHQLFVTEACSGLRSLTALLSLGVLVAGLWLKHPATRAAVMITALPVAMGVNAIRVFLTGFLVYYVSPAMGEGFMHLSEGWLLFLVALVALGVVAWAASAAERRWLTPRAGPVPSEPT